MGLFDRLRGRNLSDVVVIGLDGVSYSLLADHPSSFPAFNAIVDAGTAGPIDSIHPPSVTGCWSSLTTGHNPGKTGVYGVRDREIGSYDTYVPTGGDVQTPRVWEYFEDAGASATVLNVPVTFPPQRTVSRMVAGLFAPTLSRATHPESLAAELDQMGYRLTVDSSLGHATDKTPFIETATETMTARMEAFRRYLERDDWTLFFGAFTTPDLINHFLYGDYLADGQYAAEFFAFYRQLDSYLGEIYDRLDAETTFIVTSAYGVQNLDYEVNLTRWLQHQGYLSFETDNPEGLIDIAAESKAYALAGGRIYINRSDREPRGRVPDADYEEVCESLIDALESLTGPAGTPVCEQVVRGETLYEGPHTDIAPDLVVFPTAGFDLTAEVDPGGDVFTAGERSGMHSYSDATFLIDDPTATVEETTDILDLAPTILDAAGLGDASTDMDGGSLL